MQTLWQKAYRFFTSPETPNSAFYVTATALLGIAAHVLVGSGNPVAMAAGSVLAAVYTLSQNHKEAQVAQAKAEAAVAALAHADIKMPMLSLKDLEISTDA